VANDPYPHARRNVNSPAPSDPAQGIRVHELAAELGITSTQVLSVAERLGFYLRSDSSQVGLSDARRIKEAWRARQPRPGGPPAGRPAPPEDWTTAVAEEDPDDAAIRRFLGVGTTQAPHRPRLPGRPRPAGPPAQRPPTNALATELQRREPRLSDAEAAAHAQAWVTALAVAPEDCIPWLEVFRHDQLAQVKRLAGVGITPDLLNTPVQNGRTAGWLLRKGEPVDYVVRLLRDQGKL
jgi:hypothetical protein